MLIVPVIDQKLNCRIGQLDRDFLLSQTLLHVGEQDRHDFRDVLLSKRVEHDHIVETVEELGVEHAPHFLLHLL